MRGLVFLLIPILADVYGAVRKTAKKKKGERVKLDLVGVVEQAASYSSVKKEEAKEKEKEKEEELQRRRSVQVLKIKLHKQSRNIAKLNKLLEKLEERAETVLSKIIK